MKKKTYIKQGAYQKVENTRGTDIKGALNLNKEVLDTLVDKGLASTNDCCNYYIGSVPRILQSEVTPEYVQSLPLDSFFVQVDVSGNFANLCFVSTIGGVKDFASIYP